MKNAFLFLNLILISFFSCQNSSSSNNNNKAAMIAGSINQENLFSNLEMYPDSTYVYNYGKKSKAGHWHKHKDGYLLFEGETNGNPVIKISHLKAEVYNSTYNSVGNMDLKEYNPPQIITHPQD